MQGLMRMRLTPDLSKLLICTTGGYMVLVHNLSLKDLAKDFQDFKPNMYRLMQISNYPLPQPGNYTKLFFKKRNRVEFISDFPTGNDAELIHSLQVHPQGWSVLSRNTSTDNASEWTCVHDIQDIEPDVLNEMRDKLADENPSKDISNMAIMGNSSPFFVSSSRSNQLPRPESPVGIDVDAEDASLSSNPRVEIMLRPRHERQDEEEDEGGGGGEDEYEEDYLDDVQQEIGYGSVYYRTGERNGLNVQLRFSSRDVFEAIEHIEIRRQQQQRGSRRREIAAGPSRVSPSASVPLDLSPSSSRSNERHRSEYAVEVPRRLQSRRSIMGGGATPQRIVNRSGSSSRSSTYMRNAFVIRTGLNHHRAILVLPPEQNYDPAQHFESDELKIVKNISRLTNYIEEPNKGRGFIKELCFSSDGRLICSPFDCGVRLMMFDDQCSELSHCVQKNPQPLSALSTNICHNSCVVSTKFSPVDCLLVSGCLSGKIVWHQPVI